MNNAAKPHSFKDKSRSKGQRLGSIGRYVDQRHATALARTFDEKLSLRMWACNWVAYEPTVVLARSERKSTAKLSGLTTCKNIWLCPVCSGKISWKRSLEVNALLHWAREQGHCIQMLTLTARHGFKDGLAEQIIDLKEAKKRLRQRREWRALRSKIVGTIDATEVTHGGNGWHTHFHLIVITRAPVDLAALLPVWLACLKGVGMSGNWRALQVQDASAVKEYLTKFGAAEELTLGNVKKGREGQRTPWQLLGDSRQGDKRASALWVEYAQAFKGRRQLVWSNGLKAMAGVKQQTDEQLAQEIAESDFQPVREWPSEVWPLLRSRRGNLLDAAARGEDLAPVEVGPTDEQTALADIEQSEVVEKDEISPATARQGALGGQGYPKGANGHQRHRLARPLGAASPLGAGYSRGSAPPGCE